MHDVHDDWLCAVLYCPTGHAVHADRPLVALYVPALQPVHEPAAAPLYHPAAQFAHAVDPPGEYCPELHAAHWL